MSDRLPDHQISLYLDEGTGWNMALICCSHDEYECGYQEFLEEVGAEEFMSRYTGPKHQILRFPVYFTAIDELSWSNKND